MGVSVSQNWCTTKPFVSQNGKAAQVQCVCLRFPILRNPRTEPMQIPNTHKDQTWNCDHLVMDRHRGSGTDLAMAIAMLLRITFSTNWKCELLINQWGKLIGGNLRLFHASMNNL
jgi:hypothetical protein